jgi:hypothetical protein
MKIVIRTVCFHFLCIIFFGILYLHLKDNFEKNKDEKDLGLIDYILFSTTIQAGVGISDIYPISFYGKITMIIQQFLMICTHVFTIYIFNV